MKQLSSFFAILALAAVLAAGCTGTGTVAGTGTPTPTATAPVTVTETTTAPVTTQTPHFELGESYLSRPTPYSFTSEKDLYTEQFRVTNEPWGIEFTVNPTHEDPQYTWFEMKVTQLDTGRVDRFGYGRTYALEKYQQFPMYASGPYRVEMTGNRVSVKVNIGKRLPETV